MMPPVPTLPTPKSQSVVEEVKQVEYYETTALTLKEYLRATRALERDAWGERR